MDNSSLPAEKPTLHELTSFQCREDLIDITVRISTKYYTFGIKLLEDRDGSRMDAIEHRHQRDPIRINTDVMKEWLLGKGRQPVSWTTLATVLEGIGLSTLAQDIRNAKTLPIDV